VPLEVEGPVPNPETLFGGKYRTVRPLGEGGMGTVFEVENVLTQKRAAIKWLHPRLQTGPEFARRMLREARAMARIRHQNVVDVYDVLLEGNDICLVMELLEGELLSERLTRASVSIAEFLSWLLPAMRGVAAAHAVGVVHRDIKPENIFLSSEAGQAQPIPKVIDFGISKVFNPGEESATCSGVTMGTPRYVSYEQLRGLRDVDGRTDTYAFGVIMFEALTGRAPYQADTLGQQAIQFVTSVPPAIGSLNPAIPEPLAARVERAISRDREQRYESLTELVDALTPLLTSEPSLTELKAFPPLPTTPRAGGGQLAPASQTTSEASRFDLPALPVSAAPTLSRARMVGWTLSLTLTAALAGVLALLLTPQAPQEAPSAHQAGHAAPSNRAAPPSATSAPSAVSAPSIIEAPLAIEPPPATEPLPPTAPLHTASVPAPRAAPKPRARRRPEAAPSLTSTPSTRAPAAPPQAGQEPVAARSGRLSRHEF